MSLPSASTRKTPARILILGGTGEAVEIAARLAHRTDLITVSSLAGRVRNPELPAGLVRVGGFGGVAGLATYLGEEQIDVVLDATHPFAAIISRNAEAACSSLGLPLIALERSAWTQVDGDRWLPVRDVAAAADCVDETERRVFLAIGRQELPAFLECRKAWFLIRAIDQPDALPPRAKLILRRGPFELEQEIQMLRDHAIDSIVSKNSGGAATYAKIEAARVLGLPVVMVDRPRKHAAATVGTIDMLIAALDSLQAARKER